MNERLEKIRVFLLGRLRLKGFSGELGDNDSLFLSARLDSLDAIDTVLFLEEEMGTRLSSIGLGASLIDTPVLVLELVERQGQP